MNREDKAQWIDQTLGSLDGMQRAPAPATLHSRVMARIGAKGPKRIVLRMPVVWLAAAGFLLLVGLNGYALIHHRGVESLSRVQEDARPERPPHDGNPLAEEYFAPTGIL